jgi:uncharacterized protein YqeY
MGLTDRISEDLKEAMKARDAERTGALRMLRAALIELEKSGKEVTEDLEVQAIQKQVKMSKEAVEQFEEAGRDELAARERHVIDVASQYLPQPLSGDEIGRIVDDIIEETGAAGMDDFKVVMPKAIQMTRGRAEGGDVQRIVRDRLTSS